MSYNSREGSVDNGSVVELYEFRQNATYWRYASCANPISKGNDVYEPSSVTRDRIKQTGDTFKNDLRLQFNRQNEFALQFINYTPDSVTTVSIYRGHFGDDEWVSYWKGRVISGEADGNNLTINCESVFTSIKRPGLRARYEYSCRHPLYSVGCGVSGGEYKVQGTIQALYANNVTLEIPVCAGFPDGWFTGGFIVVNSQRRFVVNHENLQITISRPFELAKPGAVVDIYPGCDHSKTTCKNKFDNLDNFGGFPWIPSVNPFGGSSIV